MCKRLIRISTALLLIILQCGCWNRIELNELSIVSATAVDINKDGKWQISYQLVIPQAISATTGISTNAAPVYVFSTEGESIRGAINNTSKELSRKLYFAHNLMVVVSEEAAKAGIAPLLDVYLRNPDSRETVTVFLTHGRARLILEQLVPMEKIPAAAVLHMVQNETKNGSTLRAMTVFQMMQDLLGPTHSTGIPSLTITGSGEQYDSLDLMKKTYAQRKIKLSQLGIIKDNKLIGWLSGQDSAGTLWLAGQIKNTTVSFACNSNSKARSSSFLITKANTKVTPQVKGGKIRMRVNVKASGSIVEYRCTDELSKPASITKVERDISEELKRVIMKSWKSLQKHHADIVGFGTIMHEDYPQYWKKIAPSWNDRLDRVELDLQVKVKVNRVGLSNRSFESTLKMSEK